MAYDPSLPVNNSPVSSEELRNQFQGLKDELDIKVDDPYVQGMITAQTAANCDVVADLTFAPADPPTSADIQVLIDKINEMLNRLRRP